MTRCNNGDLISFPSAFMAELAEGRSILATKLGSIRRISHFLGIGNLAVLSLGWYLLSRILSQCSGGEWVPFAIVAFSAGMKLAVMVGAAIAQHATAATIVGHAVEGYVAMDAALRHKRRKKYRCLLCWTRFGMAVTILQFLGALSLLFIMVSDFAYGGEVVECFLGQGKASRIWKQFVVISFLVLVWFVVVIHCCAGSDVLRWTSFYATHDAAWKAHYEEVFDHGIREFLCCLGRVKYLSAIEEDDVFSLARLLGDLVVHHGSGAGHLELFAGLALLQWYKETINFSGGLTEAPTALIQEAALFQPYAEAAYTGPLLDIGRNPVLFPCAWLYRQGFLTPWDRNSRPALEGDNWWRGHAAAFLKFVKLSPNALLCGRVFQKNRESAYFVTVLHEQRSVVITVRGTETPEDLITDGLCRECSLSVEDLDGIINNDNLPPSLKQRVLSSFPHYGHSGIVESARELFIQLVGQSNSEDDLHSETPRFLPSMMEAGCECHGYKIYIVGHSLGGAVATILGLKLTRLYPNLHVYAYGTPPCVDAVVADACSYFVTTIVNNSEFSSRLSVNSVLRLRAAAITALSDDSSNSAVIRKLLGRILCLNESQMNGGSHTAHSPFQPRIAPVEGSEQNNYGSSICNCGSRMESSSFDNVYTEMHIEDSRKCNMKGYLRDGFYECNRSRESSYSTSADVLSNTEETSQLVEESKVSTEILLEDSPELFLPGLIIHVVQVEEGNSPSQRSTRAHDKENGYRALLADRESFKDVVITPSMFLDHLPWSRCLALFTFPCMYFLYVWRCHFALQRVLEAGKSLFEGDIDPVDGEQKV